MAEPNSSGGGSSALKRYGPIAAVVVVVIGAIIIFGSGGDDSGDDDVDTSSGSSSDLPVIYQDAENPDDIEWGEGCDPDTGRISIPMRNSAPCVEAWDESEDNGGATSTGVTADSIKVVLYEGEPDPLQQALVGSAGADTDPADVSAVEQQYMEMLDEVFEQYGRTFDSVVYKATGGPSDATAAQADAQAIIDMEPFAVIGGPAQTEVFWQEITDAEILCIYSCSTAVGWDEVNAAGPYLWPTAFAPEQADEHLLELVGRQLVRGKAEFAGDEELQSEDRVFGWIQAETETGEYDARVDEFEARLAEEYDGEIAARSTYLFNPAASQEIATTVVTRMKDAGVTTIIISTDPLIPAQITQEATKQGYFPEWVIGPSVLADTTLFGRTFDQEQWSHALGLGLPAARADNSLTDAFRVYEWYYGVESPVNTVGVVWPGPWQFALGVHLAGPNLTPETFRDGLFRYPANDLGLTYLHTSWDEELWGKEDLNGQDDATAIWWDPTATGEDEAGNEGTGMMRYVDGGKRYLPGEWPDETIAFFEEEGSVTVYDELPEGDAPPDYPPWPGSPAAG